MEDLYKYENELYAKGLEYIGGVDEVGRGPLIGSVVASILGSFVKQFYMEQEYIPRELIIEDEIEDSFILEEWLSTKKGQKVTIRVPQKGEKKNLVDMVRKNAMEYLEKFSDMNKLKYEKSLGALEQLKDLLGLEEIVKSFYH